MKFTIVFLSCFLFFSCTKQTEPSNSNTSPVESVKTEKTVVIIGDSLTEGYGVQKEKAYPFLLEEKFASKDRPIQFINSGISGSTSASAPDRVQWAIKSNPDVIILALGANDGLRGLPAESMKQNLEKAILAAKEKNIKVILFGLMVPPNFGARYSRKYEKVFQDLAKEQDIPLLPFLLKDVAGLKHLNQADGIHPNEEGHKIMAETTFEFLKDHI